MLDPGAVDIRPSTERSGADVPGTNQSRLSVNEVFRNGALARRLEIALADMPGIRGVKASALTGRLVVRHDRSVTPAWLKDAVRQLVRGQALRRTVPVSWTAAPPAAGAPQQPIGPSTSWHAMDADAVLAKIASGASGLDPEEAAQRLRRFGPNALPEPLPPSAAALIFDQFKSLPVMLLLGSAGLSLATRAVLDAGITVAVVLVNAAIGYSTESASQRTILAMTKRTPWPVRVRRGGRDLDISSDTVVPGDMLVLGAGGILPADARVIAASDLMINEALLTGESEPAEKHPGCVAPDAALSTQTSMVRRGTFVSSGTGLAVVVATGAETEIGRIETAASSVRPPPTVMEQDLGRLGTQLAVISGVVCAGVFGIGILGRRPIAEMFKSSVALAVAAVPEGLPAIATTTLALELQRLRKKKVIVRRLHAVEGLGSVNVLCFDKTGTLTQNNMSAASLALPTRKEPVPLRADTRLDASRDLTRLLETASLCSDVEIETVAGETVLKGSGTECAILRLAMEQGIDLEAVRRAHPRTDALQRNAHRRLMATYHASAETDRGVVAVKGDPHSVLERSQFVGLGGTRCALDGPTRHLIRSQIEAMSNRALRVLGFAHAEAGGDNWADAPLVWAGAVGLADPVRPGSDQVIADLHGAGIRTVMITGDQSATARAIAEELDLANGEPLQILDASDLSNLPPDLLGALAARSHVFARVSPTQKLDIVQALQANGDTVAMTGDGFNDAPAMRAADIGIAIGANSAGAARDVADIVIAGEHIRHIADGIRYGRTVQTNVRKTVHFMLSTNLSEILIILAETLNRADQIESPLELLWLNLLTDILPGFGLAVDPPEDDILSRPPRAGDMRLIDSEDLKQSAFEASILAAGALAAHGYGLAKYGPGPQTRALTLFSIITGQLLHAFNCRTDLRTGARTKAMFGNAALNAAVGSSLAVQALPVLVPSVSKVLGIGRMGPSDLAVAAAAGLGAFGLLRALPRCPDPLPKSSHQGSARDA